MKAFGDPGSFEITGWPLYNPTWTDAVSTPEGESWTVSLRVIAYDGELTPRKSGKVVPAVDGKRKTSLNFATLQKLSVILSPSTTSILSSKRGEIHAILGENGAGKSTLMNLIYGLYQPSAGRIYVTDREGWRRRLQAKSPRDAILTGIGMVHQHFMLVENLTVAENIALSLGQLRNGRRKKTWMEGWKGGRNRMEGWKDGRMEEEHRPRIFQSSNLPIFEKIRYVSV